jgi:S-adenosylmethionine hydrolase
MKLITLTSDMGLNDHYVAALKASIISKDEEVRIIDVSHAILPFDVGQAAFFLNSCISEFPKGTVHLVCLDGEPIVNFGGYDGSYPCILQFQGPYIVSNDNGFFGAFIGENEFEKLWRIEDVLSNPRLFKFPSKNMLVPVALRILNGEKLENFASEVDQYRSALVETAIIKENLILGSVVYIDSYGNAITNIHQSLFEKVGQNHPFTIHFRNKDYYLDFISNTYNEVPPGEKVAIFNEKGFIEIAINRGANKGAGGANTLFGITKNQKIRVEFLPPGSKETLDQLF